jgi:PAS domain S-box-containing protein
MAMESPLLGPRGEDPSSPPVGRLPPPWHLVLFSLATLSVLALSGLLYLDTRVNAFYAHSVAETRRWSDRQESYAQLGKLATDLVELSIDSSGDGRGPADLERQRMATTAFHAEIDGALEEADEDTVGALHTILLEDLGAIRDATDEVLAETEVWIACAPGATAEATAEHAATQHRARRAVHDRIQEMEQRTREFLRLNLSDQENAVRDLLHTEIAVVLVVVLVLGGLCLYGGRMWRHSIANARELDRSEAILRDSERRMRLVLDSAHDAFVAIDAKGHIVEWNARAELVFGWKRAEVLGRDLAGTIIPNEQRQAHRRGLERYLREGKSELLGRCVEMTALHRSGTPFPVEMAATAVATDDRVAFTAFLRDIAERKRAEEALRKSEERFDLAVRGSSDGLWDWNVPWDELYLSPRCKELMHAEQLQTIGRFEAWSRCILADDRVGVEKALQRHFRDRAPFDVECRIRTPSSEIRWLRVRGQAVWNERGEAVRIAGSITEITQQKQTIETLLRLQGIAEAKSQIEAQAAQLATKTAELEHARAASEAANRSKSEFLANMSHEIRTPMTAILGYSDLLANPSLSTEDRLDGVQRIRQNGRHLLAILNDILDISKIEAGKMTVERIECRVPEIVTEIAALMRPRAVEKGLDLRVEFAGRVPATVRSDPTRLRQILMNLMGNAIKFTERGSVRLLVGMQRLAPESCSRIVFEVVDTGIGMGREQIASLFKPFTQGDPSMARRFGGTGLGLIISRRLAEMLGGTISVTSQPGQGTTFRVEIETGPLDGVGMILPIEGAELLPPDDAPPGHDARSGVGGDLLAGVRILLADDARDNRKIVSYHLRRAGATVDLAENGRMATDAVLSAAASLQGYDIVLMDMQMPELDGFAATRCLREGGFLRPIIALTAHAMTGDREQCLAAGCDDYATKPIDPQQLLLTISRWVGRRAAVDQVAAALPRKPAEGEEPPAGSAGLGGAGQSPQSRGDSG